MDSITVNLIYQEWNSVIEGGVLARSMHLLRLPFGSVFLSVATTIIINALFVFQDL
jgi:hypothetical protein